MIIVGGGRVGCEIADFLAQRGKRVVIVEILPALFSEEAANFRPRVLLLRRLKSSGVRCYLDVKKEKITDFGMEIQDAEGKVVSLKADSVVLAAGSAASDDTLSLLLQEKISEIFKIGDCVKPRQILEAIREGAEAALQI